jgi:hypothetical protein
MTVTQEGPVIRLHGPCRVEDAEPLSALLQRAPGTPLDLSACESLHTAVVQAILAFAPPIAALPGDAFLRDLVLPDLLDPTPGTERQPVQ